MYNTTDAYKAAMKRPVHRQRMTGTIGNTEFTDEGILKGSFMITNQCSGNDEIAIGQVYTGELDATFMGLGISRYGWKGLEIKPVFGLMLEDGTYEDVPLGVFTVASADWTESGVVVKAYDHMALLDEPCNEIITEVTPYECAQKITKETGVVFSNTKEEFEAFANGTLMLSETTTNDVETWRDLLSWLSQAVGCFATADRTGGISLRPYGRTPVDTIDPSHRFTGASFSDYETRYTGISVVNMSDDTTSYYGLEVDDGLTMNLGSNPFLQYGLLETLENMRRSVLTAVSAIDYVPFTAKALGDPAYDLGDVLVFSDGIADSGKLYCITKYTFRYGSGMEMSGVGKDPSLADARSRTDKDLSGLVSNTDANTLVHYLFSNTQVSEIGDGEKHAVATIRFATATKSSEVSLRAELLLDTAITSKHAVGSTITKDVTIADADAPTPAELQEEIDALGESVISLDTRMTSAEKELADPSAMTVLVTYTLAGEEIDYHPVETYDVGGKHILSLSYYIGNVKANTVYIFVIFLTASGGSVYLDVNSIHAVIEGMGLAGTGKWDGTITVEDEYSGLSFSSVLGGMSDSAEEALLTPVPAGAADSFAFSFASVLGGFTDTGLTAIVVRYYILSKTEGKPSYGTTYITTDDNNAFVLITNFNEESTEGTIDEGYKEVLDIRGIYPDIDTLESVVIS